MLTASGAACGARSPPCQTASNRVPARFLSYLPDASFQNPLQRGVLFGADRAPHIWCFSGYFSWLRQFWLGSRFGAD
jgi:hypothetical protein